MAEPKSKPPAKQPIAANPTQLLETSLKAFLAGRCADGTRLCVALSGGRDSVVLLHALKQLRHSSGKAFRLSAVHVHHGLSANADAWSDFCAGFCRDNAIPLQIVRVDVPRDSGEGLEASARRARHAVFAGCEADLLALAHHQDDQAETVLLNLLRGAGIAGAAGMLAERPQALGPSLVRPLLNVSRQVIDAYADGHGLRWIEDESNADVHFRRNFLRQAIIPQLEEKFPGTKKSLARAAAHFAEGAALLDELAALDRSAVATPAGRIGLAAFNALPVPRARNLLRCEWLAAGFRAPDTRWIEEARRQLASATSQSETCLTTPDGQLHVYRGEIHIVACHAAPPAQALLWSGDESLPWAGGRVRFAAVQGAGIRRSLLIEGRVCLKPRQGSERLQPHVKRPRRDLRKLLQEAAVPPWERLRLPLLWSDEKLLWVGGIGIDASCACPPDEAGVLPVWEPL